MKAIFIRILMVLTLSLIPYSIHQNQLKIVYTSPSPDSALLPPGTTITIRLANPTNNQEIAKLVFNVIGSISGPHPGEIILAPDQKTVIFQPKEEFAAGEKVIVRIGQQRSWPFESNSTDYEFNFMISQATLSRSEVLSVIDSISVREEDYRPVFEGMNANLLSTDYITISENIPAISVSSLPDQTADGYLFISSFLWSKPDPRSYNLILDNTGDIVYFQHLERGYDFKALPNGTLSYILRPDGYFTILDHSYNVIDTVKPGNGYSMADPHDLQLTPNGNYLLLIYDAQIIDMSTYGGNPQAKVVGLIIQELDVEKNVIFQWRSWDHMQITDTYVDLTTATVDYVHGNAVEVDNSGNLMISSRHLSEITKINRETGDIIWRLGGKNNEFTFINDPRGFHFQHDIRQLPNGNITLFDNHNDGIPSYSRAVEYELDENAKTATQVWEYRNTPDTYSAAMGDTQRLPNGNTMIGWGFNYNQVLTEVKPDGSKALELVLEPGYVSYRAFRLPWHGYPTWSPALVVTNQNNDVVLYTSWNGATEIASYRVYGGQTTLPATFLDEQTKTGFETSITLAGVGKAYCYFKVMPIDTLGRPTQYSDVVINPACVNNQYFLPLISSMVPN